MYLSCGGLKATLVTVNECPSNGVPADLQLSFTELIRTTACAGDVDLQVEANMVFDAEAAMDMDWNQDEKTVGDIGDVL
jgi:hypothetical protein